METRAAARRWCETWERGWAAADAEAIVPLYADDATFYSHPFRDRQPPAEYVQWAFAGQAAAECRFGEPIVEGDRAAVDWWAVIRASSGSAESLAGTSLLRFDGAGLVVEQRDVWAASEGRRELDDWTFRPR